MENESFQPDLTLAFAWSINDYMYHPLNEMPEALTEVKDLVLYRGIPEDVEKIKKDGYNHPAWQMWTTDLEVAKKFADNLARGKSSVLKITYSGMAIHLDDIFHRIKKETKKRPPDEQSEIDEALATYTQELHSFILPPSCYEILTVQGYLVEVKI